MNKQEVHLYYDHLVKTAKKEAVVPARTSPLKIFSSNQKQKGFTLFELMVVLMIIGALVAFGATRVNNDSQRLKAEIRRFTALSKQLRASSKLTNSTYRLVIDMHDGDKEKQHQYWVEKSDRPVLFSEDVEKAREKELDLAKETKDSKKKKASPGDFSIDKKILKNIKSLPKGVYFKDVELVGSDRPFTTGKVYIHFLPQGMVEESVIHISAGDTINWTLAIHPLTGKLEIITKYEKLEDIRDQK